MEKLMRSEDIEQWAEERGREMARLTRPWREKCVELRTAGDALAEAIRAFTDPEAEGAGVRLDAALARWERAARGEGA